MNKEECYFDLLVRIVDLACYMNHRSDGVQISLDLCNEILQEVQNFENDMINKRKQK